VNLNRTRHRLYRIQVRRVAAAFKLPRRERTYTTLLMATGLTFGSIAALFGLTHDLISKTQPGHHHRQDVLPLTNSTRTPARANSSISPRPRSGSVRPPGRWDNSWPRWLIFSSRNTTWPPQWSEFRVLPRPWFPAELAVQRSDAPVWVPAACS
jgi:hypothetical protein